MLIGNNNLKSIMKISIKKANFSILSFGIFLNLIKFVEYEINFDMENFDYPIIK